MTQTQHQSSFFNFFFEAELSATILTAHGTSRSSSSNMATYSRERRQTTESGAVVGPATELTTGVA